MFYDPKIAYNDLPLLPPEADIETKQLLKLSIKANTALTKLNEAIKSLPNPAVIINTLPLQEAKASSEIENIVTTSDELFKASLDDAKNNDPAVKETLRYRQALRVGSDMLEKYPITTKMACKLCSTIKDTDMNIRKIPGTQIANTVTGEVIYTPPEGESVIRDKLSNWEKFINENIEVEPLIRLAVMHYQFEAIHPFLDGNGRTGRLVNVLFLIQEGILEYPVLYLSKYIIENKAKYYSLLKGVTANSEWEGWITYILEGLCEVSNWTVGIIKEVKELMSDFEKQIKDETKVPQAKDIVEVIFTQPYCRVRDVVDAGIAQRQTAMEYLRALEKLGILKPLKPGREILFINRRFMNILDGDTNKQTNRDNISNALLGDIDDIELVKRQKDIKVISQILLYIHIDTIDDFLQNLPYRINDKATVYWEGFHGFVISGHYHLYDEKLDDYIQSIHKSWGGILKHDNYYSMSKNGKYAVLDSKMDLPVDNYQTEAMGDIKLNRDKMLKEFHGLIKYLRNEYLEIDVDELSQKSWEMFESL